MRNLLLVMIQRKEKSIQVENLIKSCGEYFFFWFLVFIPKKICIQDKNAEFGKTLHDAADILCFSSTFIKINLFSFSRAPSLLQPILDDI